MSLVKACCSTRMLRGFSAVLIFLGAFRGWFFWGGVSLSLALQLNDEHDHNIMEPTYVKSQVIK